MGSGTLKSEPSVSLRQMIYFPGGILVGRSSPSMMTNPLGHSDKFSSKVGRARTSQTIVLKKLLRIFCQIPSRSMPPSSGGNQSGHSCLVDKLPDPIRLCTSNLCGDNRQPLVPVIFADRATINRVRNWDMDASRIKFGFAPASIADLFLVGM